MSKLDDILEDPQTYWVQDAEGDFVRIDMGAMHRLIKQQIKDLMLELIGEDETETITLDVDPKQTTDGSSTTTYDVSRMSTKYRNQLRAELRQKVNEL